MNYKIYFLSEKDGPVRYVGQTRQELLTRLKGHLKNSTLTNGRSRYVCNWIKFRKENITINLLEEGLTLEEANEMEIFYISYFRFLGFKLTNLASGGAGARPKALTETAKNKIRETALKNNPQIDRNIYKFYNKKTGETIEMTLYDAFRYTGIESNMFKKIKNGIRTSYGGWRLYENIDRDFKKEWSSSQRKNDFIKLVNQKTGEIYEGKSYDFYCYINRINKGEIKQMLDNKRFSFKNWVLYENKDRNIKDEIVRHNSKQHINLINRTTKETYSGTIFDFYKKIKVKNRGQITRIKSGKTPSFKNWILN